MASKTSLTEAVKRFDVDEVRSSLDETPGLLHVCDDRGRKWLHLCASVDVSKRPAADIARSLEVAADLLDRGLGIDDPAFTEDRGRWHATPVWYSIARGRNRAMAQMLLERGASPEHTLFAAAFNHDLDAIDLLVKHGATLDAVVEDETPFLGGIKTSHFDAAWRLADHGANVDFVDPKGMTALHYMIKKSSEPEHFEAFVRFRPRADLAGPDGKTAAELLARKRDPRLKKVAEQLTS